MSIRTGSTPVTRVRHWRDRRHRTERRRHEQRRRAFDLLPEIPEPHHHRRSVALPLALLVVTLALVAGLFAAYWQPRTPTPDTLGVQAGAVGADLPAAERHTFAAAGRPPAPGNATAPVVLALHDVRPGPSGSRYVLTPRQLARHLEMMRLAGYHSMTGEQFVQYTQGRYHPPPRSVLLTFDDGTSGLYTYADPILDRYGFTAVSFLITGHITARPGYYLSWDQIHRLRDSGRWQFGDHTHDLHHKGPSVAGPRACQLTSRQIIAGHRETYAEFTRRVRQDLDRSLADLADHDLPRPDLFAWPFSEVTGRAVDPRAAAIATQIVRSRFTRNVINRPNPVPVTAVALAQPWVERQEVDGRTSETTLFTRLQNMQNLPVTAMAPDRVHHRWTLYGKDYTALDATARRDGMLRPTQGRRYLPLEWEPARTAAWTTFSMSATTDTPGHTGVGLLVHTGPLGNPVRVNVSASTVTVTDRAGKVLTSRSLRTLGIEPVDTHRMKVQVTHTTARVWVNGVPVYNATIPAGHGGPGISFTRREEGDPWGTISDLRVGPVPGS